MARSALANQQHVPPEVTHVIEQLERHYLVPDRSSSPSPPMTISNSCYAHLHPKATNCHKKKCGHSNKLRKKKPFESAYST